jgi:hypothetical protein
VRYDQCIGDVRRAVAAKLGVAPEQQQLFFHKRELQPADDARTLLEMDMHTGFALKGYDLVSGGLVSGGGRPRRDHGEGAEGAAAALLLCAPTLRLLAATCCEYVLLHRTLHSRSGCWPGNLVVKLREPPYATT